MGRRALCSSGSGRRLGAITQWNMLKQGPKEPNAIRIFGSLSHEKTARRRAELDL